MDAVTGRVKEEVTSITKSGDDPSEKTQEKYWTIWATHVLNDSTVQETARTFDCSRITIWRALRWCSDVLAEHRSGKVCVEALLHMKRIRLRDVRKQREATMKDGDHRSSQGYLREERELEDDIAELEGAERLMGRTELSGPDGGPVEVEQSGKQRIVLEGEAALAVVAFHEELAEDGDDDEPAVE